MPSASCFFIVWSVFFLRRSVPCDFFMVTPSVDEVAVCHCLKWLPFTLLRSCRWLKVIKGQHECFSVCVLLSNQTLQESDVTFSIVPCRVPLCDQDVSSCLTALLFHVFQDSGHPCTANDPDSCLRPVSPQHFIDLFKF